MFDILTGLFNQLGIRTNTWRTVIIAYQPFHAPDRVSVEAYERLTTGTVTTLQERHRM